MQEIVVIDGEISLENTLDGEVELEAITDLDPDVVMSAGGGITPSGTIEITENGVYDVTEYASADVDVQGGITPTGTKQISITQNGTTTEDVTNYANAEINVNVPASAVDTGTKSINSNGTHDVVGYANASVNVPNSYSASDEGKVVSNGALVAQSSDTVTTNDTYDTTLIDELTVNVPTGGGGMPLLDVITVSENVRAVNLDLTPYHNYDMVFIISDVTLSASDWLYTVVNGSEPSGGNYTQTSLVNHRGLFAYMGKLAGRPTATEQYTGYTTTSIMTWNPGYANNLYIYTYSASKTILADSKFYIYGGTYADILQ